ncbi:MAG: ABC transporter permease [Chloroflexi bacterium]|nr:ABC transporter permease [Chloroflexota bacterium]
MTNLNTILTVAYRDLLKFLRDRPRIVASFVFPFVVILFLGESLDASIGKAMGYDFKLFVFTGVYTQTLFQSAMMGIISLLDDRDNDFSQEIFVSPVSRYAIIVGKILGESLVAMAQGIGLLAFGILIVIASDANISLSQGLGLIPVGFVACLLGGSFGMFILPRLSSRRIADQIFPFLILPQYFLAGVFTPFENQPRFISALSVISPMRYAVDLTRGIFYHGTSDFSRIVLERPLLNSAVMVGMFGLFLVSGTLLFVREERNR